MMDQGFFYHKGGCSTGTQKALNLTALSLSGYNYNNNQGRNIPSIIAELLPWLTTLTISTSSNTEFTMEDARHILQQPFAYLQDLDVSEIGQTSATNPCTYSNSAHHPWFDSKTLHIPPSLKPTLPCHQNSSICLPPQLTELASRSNNELIFNTCDFQSNRLSVVDISKTRIQHVAKENGCRIGDSGLRNVTNVTATNIKFTQCQDDASCFNVRELFKYFPNMTSLDLRKSKEVNIQNASHHYLQHLNLDTTGMIFPENTVTLDLESNFPQLVTLSMADNAITKINLTLPNNLTYLNLRSNLIGEITPEMMNAFTAHYKVQSNFLLDLQGTNSLLCDITCDCDNLRAIQWICESMDTFLLINSLCEGIRFNVSLCVEKSRDSCEHPPTETKIIVIAVSCSVTLVVVMIILFFVARKYNWKFRLWLSKVCKRVPVEAPPCRTVYLSYCSKRPGADLLEPNFEGTDFDEQCEIAFKTWMYFKNVDRGLKMYSRFDLEGGSTRNVELTELIRSSGKILLLIPDKQYVLGGESRYDFELGLCFMDMRDIHPITKHGVELTDMSDRFPDLVPGALEVNVNPIYPDSPNDEDVNRFADNIMTIIRPLEQ